MPNVGLFLVMVAIVIFAVGFSAGYIFENVAVSYTNAQIEEMRVAVENMQIQEMFAASDSIDCNLIFASMGKLSYDLYSLVNSLQSHTPGSKEFENTKVQADLLSLRAWMTARNVKESCSQKVVPILYIYSDSEASKEQDRILQGIKEDYENVLVYSIDSQSDQPAIKLVKDAYSVISAPSIIIDNKNYGELDKDELQILICERINCSFS